MVVMIFIFFLLPHSYTNHIDIQRRNMQHSTKIPNERTEHVLIYSGEDSCTEQTIHFKLDETDKDIRFFTEFLERQRTVFELNNSCF